MPEPATAAAVPARPRRLPLPPLGVALAALVVTLMTIGYVLRLAGADGPWATTLSMDAVLSLPRMTVAALFAAAAVLAVAGAGRLPGRRTWWLAVGAVAGGIAAVKAGSTVHAQAVGELGSSVGAAGALAVSAAAAAAVVGSLWYLSRHERRDRRRVLGALAAYGAGAVGLSAVSSAVTGALGRASSWAAAATYVEESVEALAGVAFLVAVLAGVAPRWVLPADRALRRADDALTLDQLEPAIRTPARDGSTA
ncbi:hypothetical protein OF117_17415 [Geodermatophilus sp. YIM 151500]|nr:hypothetical protein [Geodermatophilus sp. YIM 151500]